MVHDAPCQELLSESGSLSFMQGDRFGLKLHIGLHDCNGPLAASTISLDGSYIITNNSVRFVGV